MRALPISALLLAGCGTADEGGPPEPDATPWLRECAAERGLAFEHVSGHSGRHLFPEIMSSGAALLDMDGDGDLDAYLVQGGGIEQPRAERPGNRLFENVGDGTFRDVTEGSGADDRGYGMGAASGDFDGDGDTDLFVTNLERDTLLANEGGGRFRDVTQVAGVGGDGWSTSAAFLDFDGDSDLDLFVARYVRWSVADELHCERPPHGADYCSPNAYGAPLPDTLYENRGDGTFRDVSAEAGLRTAFGNGLGVVCADFDGDGRTDVFVANDQTPNQLWRNEGGGRFADVAVARGCAVDEHGLPKAGMGVAAADVDADGDEDLLVVNLDAESDSFHRNEGTYFSDRTPLVGLAAATRRRTRFGAAFVDLDHDGFLDLFEAAGRVMLPAGLPAGDPYAETDLCFAGGPDGRFRAVPGFALGPAPLARASRAAAFGDVDGDGAVDVLVANRDAPAQLFLNVAAAGGGWTLLSVVDESGAAALGAILRIRVGTLVRRTEVRSAFSYAAANDPRVHVGLGDATEVDEVLVRWVGGGEERFGPLAAGAVHVLERGRGR